MNDLYFWSVGALKVSAPIMMGCLFLMYVFMYYVTRKPPAFSSLLVGYVRFHTARKGHIGILTYLFILNMFIFCLGFIGFGVHYALNR